MQLATHSTKPKAAHPFAVLVALALLLTALAASGCGAAATPGAGAPKTPVSGASTPATGGVAAASDVQTCLECGTKKMPAKVAGEPSVQGGIQHVSVAIVDGRYYPNTITASSSMPIQVLFAGKAKGCLAKPKFGSLNKSVDITTSGAGTIDLGTRKPGVYEFSCGMGMNKGTITVQ